MPNHNHAYFSDYSIFSRPYLVRSR